jgi:hypothetical protein
LLGLLSLLLGLAGLSLAPFAWTAAPPRPAAVTLVARPPSDAPATPRVAAGDTVQTAAGERKRVRLPDGSLLYLNERCRVSVGDTGRIDLLSGEIFVEAPARPEAEALTVKAPRREVRSSRGRFAVRATERGSRVVVASGKVQVSGLEQVIRSGQQLAEDQPTPSPAPRLSHVVAWVRDLLPESDLVPASQHAGGSITVRDPDGQEAKLTLRRYHVDVHIEDGFARTTIDQTFFNDSQERLEGTFRFPLPPDASLARLAMYVDGKRMEGGMAERDYARSVYERILYQQRDPALLEWVDGSTFKMRVFPLEPRQEKRLLLSYTQRLPVLYGSTAYRFPAGHSLGRVKEWSAFVRVRNGAGLAWDSPSHSFAARQEKGDLLLETKAKDAAFDRDVVLNLADASGARLDGESVRFCSHEQDGAKYLMLRYRPGLRGEEARPRRDWLFLVETSADRDPLLARTQIEVVRALLQNADLEDTFNVVTASTRVRTLAEKSLPVTTSTVGQAIAFLEKAHLIGALDLGQALEGVAPLLKGLEAPWLVHVGSGTPALGERRADVLARRLPAATRYVGVGVGRRWNRALMKSLAERSAGHFTQINPDERVAWRGFELAATLNTPRLLDASVTDKAGRATFLVFQRAVTQGEEVTALTRVKEEEPLPADVVVQGTLEGKPFAHVVRVAEVTPGVGHLPRSWAALEIERLLSEDAVKHRAAIVALSKAMYVLTPFTSLLVLENEDQYRQFKIDRGRKDHWAVYPAPDKIEVVYEPLDGELIGPGKPSRKQVRQTVIQRGQAPILRSPDAGRPRREKLTLAALNDAEDPAPLGSDWDGAANTGTLPPLGGSPSPGIVQPWVTEQTTGLWENDESGKRQEPMPIVFGGYSGPTGTPPARKSTATSDLWGGFPGPSAGSPFARMSTATFGLRDGSVTGTLLSDPQAFQPAERNLARLHILTGEARLAGRNRPKDWALQYNPITGQPLNPLLGEEEESPLLHRRPTWAGDDRLFFDLLQYAPGLNTSSADLRAVLENEARFDPASKPGRIDPEAARLFGTARKVGWRSLTLPAKGTTPAFTITFDGTGCFTWKRKTADDLTEEVVCDGSTLWYLYPDLGLAARRNVSRFHRLALSSLVPWTLPQPEDLARGADLVAIDRRTVALVPHGADKVEKHRRLEFVFSPDGDLAERRLVQMPDRKVLGRETLSRDGTLTHSAAGGKEVVRSKGRLEEAHAPALKADARGLVVLDLPFRTPNQVRKTLGVEKKNLGELTTDQARQLLVAEVAAGDGATALNTFRQVLHARDERHLGYYLLLAAAGANLDSDNGDVLGQHPESPLAQYLALHSSPTLRKHASQWAASGTVWSDGFLRKLALGHALCQRWQAGKGLGSTPAGRKAERDRALAYVRKYPGSDLGWALLGLVQDRLLGSDPTEVEQAERQGAFRDLASAWMLYADVPGLGELARYENARCLWRAGEKAEARQRFRAFYQRSLAAQRLPRLEADFRSALLEAGREEQGWSSLIRQTAQKLLAEKRRHAVLTLARQCWQLEDQALAQHLYQAALQGVPAGREGLGVRLDALGFLMHSNQLTEVDRLLGAMLQDPELMGLADLWRVGAALATRREMKGRELECLERALELEFSNPPEVIDLTRVRNDYGALLGHYARLAEAVVTLKLPPPPGFRARVVRAADRWRHYDPQTEAPCQQAAAVLRTLGERELAWDYLTSPVAGRPGEPGPLVGLAAQLQRQGELLLADRAFEAAFTAEPTDAQVLWDRAQNLRQAGQLTRSRALVRQLAEGTWQPRFNGLQAQARSLIAGE